MKHWYTAAVLFLALVAPGAHAADAQPFPHRAHFRDVPVIDTEQLRRQFDGTVVVDVRSRFEYEMLHIIGAAHVPLDKERLPAAVRALRGATDRPIVFYCNGTVCTKSYEAARFAIQAGLTGVYAYDAGMDAWSRRYPEMSVLMNLGPARAEDLISIEDFERRLIDARDFEARLERGAVVLDIRDLRQRDVNLFPMREQRAPLDDTSKIASAVAEAKKTKKTLLVYDKAGKQVRWFQYYLEAHGVTDYYFLAGGAEGFHETKYGKVPLKVPN